MSAVVGSFGLAGCAPKIRLAKDDYSLQQINGDITCEYRIGQNAKWAEEPVDTDLTFDKEMFVQLFLEQDSYDPWVLKEHPEQCDLKINAETQPTEWQEIFNSEVNIKALFDDTSRSVSVYCYREKLYLYVLGLGGNAAPGTEGNYYMELSKEMTDYWLPQIAEIQKAAALA